MAQYHHKIFQRQSYHLVLDQESQFNWRTLTEFSNQASKKCWPFIFESFIPDLDTARRFCKPITFRELVFYFNGF